MYLGEWGILNTMPSNTTTIFIGRTPYTNIFKILIIII